ncbi:MAG: glycosyltransferase family 47 protein [Acidobacteriota bacterium]|nr:glycosyltransferase family 47 protein [Acidobacteriota bacterium]
MTTPLRIHFVTLPELNITVPLARVLLARGMPVDINKVFEKLQADAARYFIHVLPQEADVFVYSHDCQIGFGAHQALTLANKFDKQCIFFSTGDGSLPSGLHQGIVFRESLVRSRRQSNEFPMPPFVRDPKWAGVPFECRGHNERPRLGFCGYVGTTLQTMLYSAMGRNEKVAGLRVRRRALDVLRRSDSFECLFIERNQYWGGAVRLNRARLDRVMSRVTGRAPSTASIDQEVAERVYREFIVNMSETDYNVCIRGQGNYSYRFFETLAAGRVPYLIDTDCVLPFESYIDWANHIAVVPEQNVDEADRFLRRFHGALSPAAFEKLQSANRALFEFYFEPLGFYINMFRMVLGR